MKKIVIAVVSIAAASALGLIGGTALAAGAPALLAPAGVHAAAGIASTPAPAPTYAVNGRGETYGSALKSNSPANEPDLIQAVADNGKVGYVRKTELDAADGTTAARSFKSPADAAAWQQSAAATADHTVSVYASDGTTVIGTFTVAGLATQQKVSSSLNK